MDLPFELAHADWAAAEACELLGPLPPLALSERQQQQSVLGKRARSSGAATARSTAAYRGVSHHSRTSRHEAHIWLNGKQLYLGGFYYEECAALAYDLAAVKIRGTEAVTNFPIETYAAELSLAHQVDLDDLVARLRHQAKALARIDATAASQDACCMEDWELGLSAALGGHTSLGVYGSEAEAARAVDAALLARDGLAAAASLAFPLVDYLALLDAAQVEEALRRGLLPMTVPASYRPAAAPQPVQQLHRALPPISCKAAARFEDSMYGSQVQEAAMSAGRCDGMAMLAPPVPAPVSRKASITPRAAQGAAANQSSFFN